MATRAEVENLITTKVDSDRPSTAEEVREVLTALLDYTENVESESDLKPFQFHTKTPISRDTNTLSYSFRGFENHFVNFTFKLTIKKEKDEKLYSFNFPNSHKEELKKIIGEIIQIKNGLDFVIPLALTFQDANNAVHFIKVPISANILFFISLRDDITFNFTGFIQPKELEQIDSTLTEIKTSICLHAPNF